MMDNLPGGFGLKRRLAIIPLMISTVLLFSCSAEQKLKRRVTGEWNVASYTEQNVDGEDGTVDNAGTLTFYKNGKGTKNITGIPWRRNFSEGREFRWQNSANTVTLFDKSSIFAKSWIITVNKKNRQEWKSTDRGNVQTLQLRR
ncbi:MAG: hypothetical protein EOO04_24470 [Chitinophagaceae bacterium]|nr:MAG: hypothetical protein EOO04_24470 [Chitinophagaceae bacterium]